MISYFLRSRIRVYIYIYVMNIYVYHSLCTLHLCAARCVKRSPWQNAVAVAYAPRMQRRLPRVCIIQSALYSAPRFPCITPQGQQTIVPPSPVSHMSSRFFAPFFESTEIDEMKHGKQTSTFVFDEFCSIHIE